MLNFHGSAKEIKLDDIGNLLVSAFEGGSNYWMEIEDYKEPKEWTFTDGGAEGYYGHTYPLNEGGAVIIIDQEDDKAKTYRLDNEAIQRGLTLLSTSKTYAHHWRDFVAEDSDQITGDVFLQMCLFGDVIYS